MENHNSDLGLKRSRDQACCVSGVAKTIGDNRLLLCSVGNCLQFGKLGWKRVLKSSQSLFAVALNQ